MKTIVLFEKWRDPFFDEEAPVPHMNDAMVDPDTIIDEDLDIEDQGPTVDEIAPKKPVPFIITSFGPMSVPEYSQPSKVFNFWTGHSNVVISRKVQSAIVNTAGVETFNPLSPYRFRVGVGKLFKEGVVLRNIRKAIVKEAKLSNDKKLPQV